MEKTTPSFVNDTFRRIISFTEGTVFTLSTSAKKNRLDISGLFKKMSHQIYHRIFIYLENILMSFQVQEKKKEI